MGLLSRLRRFRSETWKQLYDYSSDETAPLTFTSDLVSGEYTNKDLWQHQLKVAWEDPIAHRMCVLLSQNVFDDWFIIKKQSDEEELEEHPENAKIQEEFTRMNTKYHFTQALIAMQIFGRSFLVFNLNKHREDVIGNGYQVATLDVFTEENTSIPQESYDEETGEPEYIIVHPNAAYGLVEEKIMWNDLIWWCTRPIGRSYDGYSVMYPLWDLMTYFRESIDAMIWVHKKYGIGVWLWYIKGGMSAELKDALEDTFQNMSSRRAIICEQDKTDRVEWSGPPSGGTTSIVEGGEFILGLISAGSGIPKDIYTGVSAGAITGSEINNKALYATINKIQSDVTPYVLETIRRMGYDITDMIIEWNTRYATDELEQAQIRLLLAQAAQMEMQAEQGMGPNDIAVRVKGENQEQNQNPTGVQS